MKILLDENIDVRFKSCFPEIHEVYTVRDMNWNGIKNGQLLRLLDENKFDCWIVVDKNIPYQQNLALINFYIIILDVFRNTLNHLKVLLPEILHILENGIQDKIVTIAGE